MPSHQKRIAGQATADGDRDHFQGEGEIHFLSGITAAVTLDGTGWARLRVIAQQNLSVNVSVFNSQFDVNAGRSPNSTVLYGPENHTHIFFFAENELPHRGAGLSMEWWGLPGKGPLPNGRSEEQPLRAGQAGLLLVSTTVPGFRVEFRAGVEEGTHEYTMKLIENTANFFAAPKPAVKATWASGPGRIQRERDWTTNVTHMEPGLLRAVAWTIDNQLSARTGGQQDVLAIEQRRSPSPLPAPLLPGGGSSYRYAYHDITSPGDWEIYRHLVDSDAGFDATIYGAAFLAIPFASTPASAGPTTNPGR